ncbi:MAG TPA: type II toxin-antitoxin system VapC family toxin [Verrucomicrobiae bacterium]|jgi:tRNA(fMet)-specific endonuclease VapC
MPASGDVLLDTSVVIPFFKGDKVIGAKLASATIYLPQTVLGELYCGANLSANPAKNRNEIQNFLAAVTVLSLGVATAEHYGQIRAALAKAGTPIPENDIWIAALAVEHGLPLAARDAHFEKIAGLKTLKW